VRREAQADADVPVDPVMTGIIVGLLLGVAAAVFFRPARHNGPGTARDGAGGGPGPGLQVHRPERTYRSALSSDPALILDLAGAMLTAGRPLPSALRIVAGTADPHTARMLHRLVTAVELGAPWAAAWELALDGEVPDEARSNAGALRSSLGFAATSGAPSAAVLYAQAAQIRRRRSREAERRAAALGVQLVLPLGLCALPAFICLAVVPLVLTLLPAF